MYHGIKFDIFVMFVIFELKYRKDNENIESAAYSILLNLLFLKWKVEIVKVRLDL